MSYADGKRILVVEDEPSISQVCVRILKPEGFGVDVASSGGIAQSMLNRGKYDLFIFDIRTPGMNGMELYSYLEEKHPEFASEVIFTTGDVLRDNIEAFLERAKRPYLPKPFTPDELRAVVRKAFK